MKKLYTIIFLLTLTTTKVTDFSCKKLFHEEYKFFFFAKNLEISEKLILTNSEDEQIPGKIITSICEEIEIPAECKTEGTALLIFIPDDLINKNCIIIKNTENWEADFIKNEENDETFHFLQLDDLKITERSQDSKIIEKVDNNYKIDFQFICEKEQIEPSKKIFFTGSKNLFNFRIRSTFSCGIDLSFFKLLSDYPLITAISFLTIGLLFCFLGFKIYKEWIMFFIPLLIIVLGFYLYMAYIEKSMSHNSNFYFVIGLVFVVIIVAGLLVVFSNLLYFLLAFLVSYKVGLILHGFLAKEIEFFVKEHTEWIVIGLLFFVFLLLFLKIKDYFIIFCTALLGSSFIILSVHYFGITEFDFLFELEFNKFNDLKSLDPVYVNFIMIFGLITLIGAFTQMILFKRKKSKKNKRDNLNLELNFNN